MEQYTEADYLYGEYSDVYKSLHGIRPRWAHGQTVEWYKDALYRLQVQVEEQIREDEIRAQKAIEDFKAQIQQCIRYGAGDEITALRWILEAEQVDVNDYYDLDHWMYRSGFEYTQYAVQVMDTIKTFFVKA